MGQLFVDGSSGESVSANRTIINTNTREINIYRLVGDPPTESRFESVDVELDGSTIIGKETINVQKITFPSTRLSKSSWNEAAIVGSGTSITISGGDATIDVPNDVYTVRCYTIGVGGTDAPTDFGGGATSETTTGPEAGNRVIVQEADAANTNTSDSSEATAELSIANTGDIRVEITDIAFNATSDGSVDKITNSGATFTNRTGGEATSDISKGGAKVSLDTPALIPDQDADDFRLGTFVDSSGTQVDMADDRITITLFFGDGSTYTTTVPL